MLQLFDKSRNSTSTLLYELCIISPLDVSGHILKNVLHFNCMDKLRNGQVSQDTTPRKCRKYHSRLNLSKNVLLRPLLQSDTPLLFVIGHTSHHGSFYWFTYRSITIGRLLRNPAKEETGHPEMKSASSYRAEFGHFRMWMSGWTFKVKPLIGIIWIFWHLKMLYKKIISHLEVNIRDFILNIVLLAFSRWHLFVLKYKILFRRNPEVLFVNSL